MLDKTSFQKWLYRKGSAYDFLSMYAILFFTFIVVPVAAAFLLSFTFFDTISIAALHRSAKLHHPDYARRYLHALCAAQHHSVRGDCGSGRIRAGFLAGVGVGAAAQNSAHTVCPDSVLALDDLQRGDGSGVENPLQRRPDGLPEQLFDESGHHPAAKFSGCNRPII